MKRRAIPVTDLGFLHWDLGNREINFTIWTLQPETYGRALFITVTGRTKISHMNSHYASVLSYERMTEFAR